MSKKISVEALRKIVEKLRAMYSKKKSTPKVARIIALLGRFEKRTNPVRRIEDFGGYYKFAMVNPGFRTQLKKDTITKMRLGWLRDAVAAGLKRRSRR